MEIAGDGRFGVIAKAKEDLIRSTNIETSEDEMKVLDSFLFRCWQMGWLDGYEEKQKGEVSEEVKEEHRQMMKEIDAVRCELHHIESDNKILKEVIIRMAMEHTGVVR